MHGHHAPRATAYLFELPLVHMLPATAATPLTNGTRADTNTIKEFPPSHLNITREFLSCFSHNKDCPLLPSNITSDRSQASSSRARWPWRCAATARPWGATTQSKTLLAFGGQRLPLDISGGGRATAAHVCLTSEKRLRGRRHDRAQGAGGTDGGRCGAGSGVYPGALAPDSHSGSCDRPPPSCFLADSGGPCCITRTP